LVRSGRHEDGVIAFSEQARHIVYATVELQIDPFVEDLLNLPIEQLHR
jgi:hypothetical protein